MDRITESYLKEFIDDFGYCDESKFKTENFEKFCAYIVLSGEIPNQSLTSEDLDFVSTGKNKGIDSICFLVNGRLITSTNEIDDLCETNGYIELVIVFIQSKTSAKFSDPEVGNFGDTIKDFLLEEPEYDYNSETKKFHEIYLHLLENFANVKSFNCKACFCSLGTWSTQTSTNKTLGKKQKEITSLHNNFKHGAFTMYPYDKKTIHKNYSKINSLLEAEFQFISKSSIENAPDEIDEAYFGSLPFLEFKKIIVDPETEQIRSLFYDNVRDDLGEKNPVNASIAQTLDNKYFSIFSLLNNGVTIIAEENKGGGNNFILSNYQIVNGCQTSNVLYNHKDIDGIEKLSVPIKLIITKDEDIKDQVILATNNQTIINDEQKMALTSFQKELEKFYETMPDGLHYERRVNQYATTSIKKKNIINVREQIKTFVSIFMEEPYLVSGYFGKVFRTYKDRIFQIRHKYEPYYFSALIQYKFKKLLQKKEIDRKYNKARYHIFYLFRKIFEPEKFTNDILTRKKIIEYSESLIKKLDEDKFKDNLSKVLDLIDKSGINLDDQKEMYKKSTTNALIAKFKEEYQ